MKAVAERDARVRLEGNKNLIAAAQQTGVSRFLLQSTGFWYAPGGDLADKDERFAYGASAAVAGAQCYAELEAMTFGRTEFEAVALRYGFFYGPGTWFTNAGDMEEQVRQQQVPIIGHGQGVWNWIHIDDAADATVRALDCAPGAYNIVDDNPSEQRGWWTAFARYCGALAPPHLSERQARGASNAKAKRELGFRPRPLQWLVYTNGTKLLPGNRARLGETHFETWLTQFAGSARAASTRTDKK